MIILRAKKKAIHEKLEPATTQQFALLQKQIDADPELQRMLTTPMGEISRYIWLYSEDTFYGADYSLLAILKAFVQATPNFTLLFSNAGNKFTGFVFYKNTGTKIIPEIPENICWYIELPGKHRRNIPYAY